MCTAAQLAERSASVARILVTQTDLKTFQRHLEDVLRGKAFRGSHRSAQFLKYVVERSIHGHADELKERVIGIELFGRSPNYDTGEDAIVRVTASDVRKRLEQELLFAVVFRRSDEDVVDAGDLSRCERNAGAIRRKIGAVHDRVDGSKPPGFAPLTRNGPDIVGVEKGNLIRAEGRIAEKQGRSRLGESVQSETGQSDRAGEQVAERESPCRHGRGLGE